MTPLNISFIVPADSGLMTRPTPEPIDPQHLADLAAEVMRAARFPFLATIDGQQPRVRPVSPVRTDGFTVYIANLRAYHKTVEIEANPRVSLLVDHYDDDWTQLWWVRADGVAAIHDSGEEMATGYALLRTKYPQYQRIALDGPVVPVEVQRWSSWQA